MKNGNVQMSRENYSGVVGLSQVIAFGSVGVFVCAVFSVLLGHNSHPMSAYSYKKLRLLANDFIPSSKYIECMSPGIPEP